MSTDQAFKTDAGKPNWFLLMSHQGCAKALAGVVRVLSFAVAPKPQGKGYTPHSWREVPNAKERYEAALYRHLNKVSQGEALDDESGESHWYHVAANALFLAELHGAPEAVTAASISEEPRKTYRRYHQGRDVSDQLFVKEGTCMVPLVSVPTASSVGIPIDPTPRQGLGPCNVWEPGFHHAEYGCGGFYEYPA